jgi:hypothetical protein
LAVAVDLGLAADPATAVLEAREIPMRQNYPKTINNPLISSNPPPKTKIHKQTNLARNPNPADSGHFPRLQQKNISTTVAADFDKSVKCVRISAGFHEVEAEEESRNIGQFIVFRDDLRHVYRVAVKK